MLRIGVFTGSSRDAKPEPVIIKTQGVDIKPELVAKITSSPPKKNDSN